MQLKSICEKEGGGKNISAQLVMQNYMLERLLERSRELHKFWRRYQRSLNMTEIFRLKPYVRSFNRL